MQYVAELGRKLGRSVFLCSNMVRFVGLHENISNVMTWLRLFKVTSTEIDTFRYVA